jgi:hypothetical protein
MRHYRAPAALIASLFLLVPAARAQSTLSSTTDRLFLNFVEDATRVDEQWWEGQLEYDEGDPVDITLIRGVVAFQPLTDLEVGGRVGFGSSDGPASLPDGSGATDLDAWAKYYFNPGSARNEYAVGAIVTVPTGDDTAGLGNDAFGVGVFGALRHRLQRAVFTGKVGLRINGDGKRFGLPERDGEVSPSLGIGIITPWTDRLTFVGEFNFEGERFDGGDDDTRILGGVNWRLNNRGMLRGALGLGLSDGAPDAQITVGYAYAF